MALQQTLKNSIHCTGVGLHSGKSVTMRLHPAPAGTGISFVRTDLDHAAVMPARWDNVVDTRLCTVLGQPGGPTVGTVEHLMAALAGCGIDNAVVELDGPEMPIMDGSSLPFVQILDRAGRRVQDAPRRYIEILDVIEVVEGDKRATLSPADHFEVAFEIAFDSKAIGRQRVDLPMDGAAFRAELGCAFDFRLGTITAATPRAAFPLRLRLAERHVAGRCVLVGDAAHVVHPLAGQGMNLGFRDVACLRRVLREARERDSDLGAAHVLRRYERERRSENTLAAHGLDAIERVFGTDRAAAVALRGAGLELVGRLAPLRHFIAGIAAGRG